MVGLHQSWDEQIHEEDELRERVRAAISKLNATRAERARLEAVATDVGPTPDGTLALRHALKIHTEALHELSEAMHAFDAFLKSAKSRTE